MSSKLSRLAIQPSPSEHLISLDAVQASHLRYRHPGLHSLLNKRDFFLSGTPLPAFRARQNFDHFFVVTSIKHIAKRLNFDYNIDMSYSIDFRRKVLSVREKEGLSIRETAKRFHIGLASVSRWLNQIDPKPSTTRQRKIDKSALEKDVEL